MVFLSRRSVVRDACGSNRHRLSSAEVLSPFFSLKGFFTIGLLPGDV
jgi:hypothetical protein